MSQILLALRDKCLRSLPDVVLIGLFSPAQFTTAVQLKCKPTIFFLECHFMKGGGEWLCWLLMIAFVAEEVPVGTLIGSIPTKAGFTYRFNSFDNFFIYQVKCLIPWMYTLSIHCHTWSRMTFNPLKAEPTLISLHTLPDFRRASYEFSSGQGGKGRLRFRWSRRPLQLPNLSHWGKSSSDIESFSTCVFKQMEGGLADHVGERWCHGYERAHGSAIR